MIAVTAIPAPYSHSPLPLAPRSKMETRQTDFIFSSPSLLTLLLGSSFSLLSALSVPCAVWQCALLLPWQGTLFHRCSRNLWPNVMLPLWANKMAQLGFRVVMMMMMITGFLPFLKSTNTTTTKITFADIHSQSQLQITTLLICSWLVIRWCQSEDRKAVPLM